MLIKLFIELITKGVLFIREGFKVNVNIFLLSAIIVPLESNIFPLIGACKTILILLLFAKVLYFCLSTT